MFLFWYLLSFLFCTGFVVCRDFYLGMFKPNDFLVAQDVVYKAASPFGYTTANYGRLFTCPVTYFRVVDRLGMGRGPFTTIVRGGLRTKYIAVRIKSTYNLPISVNIYVGCENKKRYTIKRLTTTLATTAHPTTAPGTGSIANSATDPNTGSTANSATDPNTGSTAISNTDPSMDSNAIPTTDPNPPTTVL